MKANNTTLSSSPTSRRSTLLGFSLIELMTVVSIMAILAAVAFPGMKAAMLAAQQAAAMANARSIAIGMRSYATDYEGLFPNQTIDGEEFANSNEAFRELVPDYLDSEKIFVVKRSAWGNQADGKIDEESDRLKPGENHFAYISGLHTTSRTDWPLIVDGTNGSGTYSTTQGSKGGCWEGTKAIVVTVGGSAHKVRLRGSGDERFLPRYDYPEENALDVGNYMGDTAVFLDPE